MKNPKKMAKKNLNKNTQSMKMEALEPRILMSATQVQSYTWDEAFAEIQTIANSISERDEFKTKLPYVEDEGGSSLSFAELLRADIAGENTDFSQIVSESITHLNTIWDESVFNTQEDSATLEEIVAELSAGEYELGENTTLQYSFEQNVENENLVDVDFKIVYSDVNEPTARLGYLPENGFNTYPWETDEESALNSGINEFGITVDENNLLGLSYKGLVEFNGQFNSSENKV